MYLSRLSLCIFKQRWIYTYIPIPIQVNIHKWFCTLIFFLLINIWEICFSNLDIFFIFLMVCYSIIWIYINLVKWPFINGYWGGNFPFLGSNIVLFSLSLQRKFISFCHTGFWWHSAEIFAYFKKDLWWPSSNTM